MAFLHSGIEGDVVSQPPDEALHGRDVVWKLNRSLYGLRLAPRAWQLDLGEVLKSAGLVKSALEDSVFSCRDCATVVRVDDFSIVG